MNNDLEYLVKENCLLVGVNEYLKMFNIGRATFYRLIDFNRLCKICGYKMLSIKCDGNNKYKVFFGGNAHKIAFFIDNKKNVRFTEYIAFTRIVKKSLKR